MVVSEPILNRKAQRKEKRRLKKNKKRLHHPSSSVSCEEGTKVDHEKTARKKEKRSRQEKSGGEEIQKDKYAHFDPDVAAAMRRDDEEIADLEAKLGMDKTRLSKEYAKQECYGDDFGEFLDGLDDMVDRVMSNKPSVPEGEEPKKKKTRVAQSDDPYAGMDPDVAAEMRRDDEEIQALEAKLGRDKHRLHKEYAREEGYGDDFGDFLEGLDTMVDRVMSNEKYQIPEASDPSDSSDASSVSEELVPMKEPHSEYSDDEDIVEFTELHEKDEDSESNEDSLEDQKDGLQEHSEESNDDSDSDGDAQEPDHDVRHTYKPSKGEDIYGNQLESPSSKASGKYVPPHLRGTQSSDGKERARVIKRSLNNALNRLSEDTIVPVSQAVAKLYAANPTGEVHECIWQNMKVACIASPHVMIGLIPAYTACLVGVHIQSNDTVQLAEYLLEHVVSELWRDLDAQHGDAQDPEAAPDKQACNLILVLCYLYNYGVVHCSFLYSVIRNLIKSLNDLEVELLLLILSHCGRSLRSDDPLALKEIVLAVQKSAKEKEETHVSSSRVEYMLSAISDLKNNKRRQADTSYALTTSKFRKVLGQIKSTVQSSGKTVRSFDSSLRIGLDDILNAKTKGRWWKVGASWVGNQYRFSDSSTNEEITAASDRAAKDTQDNEEDEELLKLATKYRMNTDNRRSIFCFIMGSVDCEDAFEKLVKAGHLKNRAERDCVRVLMECCGNEASYNQFYAHLACRICEYQPQCKFSFQLAYWDLFKQFEDISLRKAANLAKLLFHLIVKHRSLRLTLLKVIDIADEELDEKAKIFLTIFFTSIFEYYDDPSDVKLLFNTLRNNHSQEEDQKPVFEEEHADDGEGLRASISIFFLQTMKASPKNKKGSKFRANLKAAMKACEDDGL